MRQERGESPAITIPEIRPIEIPEKDWERIHQYLGVVSSEFDLVIHKIGDYTKGEIEIVTDPVEIYRAEQEMKKSPPGGVRPESVLEAFVTYGGYSTYIQHVVKRANPELPEGFSYGLFHETVWNFERRGNWGNAVLPVWKGPDEVLRIGLVKIFRRPLGTWEAEIPRFSQDPGEKIDITRTRELMEELGCKVVDKTIDLGSATTDSGLMHLENHLWLVPVEPQEVSGVIDQEEAIQKRVFLTIGEVKEAILEKKVHFGDEEVPLRDGGLLMAWTAAQVRGLI